MDICWTIFGGFVDREEVLEMSFGIPISAFLVLVSLDGQIYVHSQRTDRVFI